MKTGSTHCQLRIGGEVCYVRLPRYLCEEHGEGDVNDDDDDGDAGCLHPVISSSQLLLLYQL